MLGNFESAKRLIFNSIFLNFFYKDTMVNSVKCLWKILENS